MSNEYYDAGQVEQFEHAAYEAAMVEAGKEWERQRGECDERAAALEVCIAELEAENAELKASVKAAESALISMVQQYCYRPLNEGIYQHNFWKADEIAFTYLVDHGLARWTDDQHYAIELAEDGEK